MKQNPHVTYWLATKLFWRHLSTAGKITARVALLVFIVGSLICWLAGLEPYYQLVHGHYKIYLSILVFLNIVPINIYTSKLLMNKEFDDVEIHIVVKDKKKD